MEAKRLRGLHASYQSAYDEATNVIEAIRDVADDAVNCQIERIAPLLQKIYTRIDPHPAFRVAQLRSKFTKGRGRVDTPVLDPRGEKEIDKPAQVFSSAQTGALAVSIFLAMNLASDGIPLHTAILDDPLQSLDDINVLGMLDALRRIRERRQLIISTHDGDFAALLRRKFRPLEVGQRTSLVTLRNWERSGVSLEQNSEVDIPPRLQVVS
jgi:energy-coupling factor transporter ATP-binding protein EcfA2